MKHIIASFFTLIICFPTLHAQAGYQETIRQYVLEKLRFFYIDNPATADPDNYGNTEVDKVAVSEGRDLPAAWWSNANNLGLKTMMKKLLCSGPNGGDSLLQREVANVLLINDKKVLVFMYNDFPNNVPSAAWRSKHPYCRTSNYGTGRENASWPCASCKCQEADATSGEIGIGAFFYNAARTTGGWIGNEDKMHVFIHELVHTQIKLALEPTLSGLSMYGTDGHSAIEMIPSKNSAFNEGIATAFAMRYHFPPGWSQTNWLNANLRLTVDNITCNTTQAPHCLNTRLATASVAAAPGCGGTAFKCYPVQTVPEDIIMHCENVTANILYQYMRQFNSETMLVRNIKAARRDMTSPSNFTFTPLFKEMITSSKRYVTPGATAKGNVLTMAILDYYAGYKVMNLGTLGKILDINWQTLPDNQRDYIDYFSMTGRQVLMTYRPNNTTWNVPNQLDRFATYLNVRPASAGTPPGPSASPTAPGGN